jgi:hypothetical protein
MFRRTALTVGLVAACFWGLVLVTKADSAPRGQGPAAEAYQPVAPLRSLMRAQATHLHRASCLARDDQAEDRFNALLQEAHILAELANVNLSNARSDTHQAWANQAGDHPLALARGVRQRDTTSATARSGALRSTCRRCHETHR